MNVSGDRKPRARWLIAFALLFNASATTFDFQPDSEIPFPVGGYDVVVLDFQCLSDDVLDLHGAPPDCPEIGLSKNRRQSAHFQ